MVHSPGAVLLEGQRVLAVGTPESIGSPVDATVRQYPGHLVCPAFVNAHSHLDLSDLPAIEERAFGPWLSQVIRHRMAQNAPGSIEKAVSLGVEQAIRGGTLAVGDICGSERALEAVRASDLQGVAFLEFLGHGSRCDEALARMEAWIAEMSLPGYLDRPGPKPGLSPHAPYSTSTAIYERALRSGLPVSSHLAESLDELEWCRDKSGIFAELNEKMGVQPRPGPSDGLHPLDGFVGFLPAERGLAVHLNYTESRHLPLLRRSGVTVVYCPRASAFFGHPHKGAPGHAWRAMAAAGIPVALGTDGRPCLAADGLADTRLSILDEILHLQRAAGITLEEWLPMATLNGARALGVPEDRVCFTSGAMPGMLALKLCDGPSRQLDESTDIEWISRGCHAHAGA